MQANRSTTSPQPTLLSELVEQAIELAAQWHDGTYRKGTWRPTPFILPDDEPVRTPVMTHLTAAAFSVQQAGWDEVTIAATFLHDILEDPNKHGEYLSKKELTRLVGTEVTRLVSFLTEEKFDKLGNPRTWKQRKVDYIAHIPTFDPGAVAICLADKHHNLWSMNMSLRKGIDIFSSSKNRKKLSSGREEQIWFFTSVLEAADAFPEDRLVPLRNQLQSELDTFIKLR
ncbi:MAG: HD domain-containing protein [Rhodothermaceae bacterium]|nr:HD domain-containing protein [Rhodothermaceae bacterium]